MLIASWWGFGFTATASESTAVYTSALGPSTRGTSVSADEVKQALRRVLVEAGVERQVRQQTQNGALRKRYLLKIAHNNGAGVDGFAASKTGEVPGYLWAVVKTLLDFFRDVARSEPNGHENRLIAHGTRLAEELDAAAPPRRTAVSDTVISASDRPAPKSQRVLGLKTVGATVKLILRAWRYTTRRISPRQSGICTASNQTPRSRPICAGCSIPAAARIRSRCACTGNRHRRSSASAEFLRLLSPVLSHAPQRVGSSNEALTSPPVSPPVLSLPTRAAEAHTGGFRPERRAIRPGSRRVSAR